jgi:hypothetical protein
MAGDPGPPEGVRENWLVQGQAVTSGALSPAIRPFTFSTVSPATPFCLR